MPSSTTGVDRYFLVGSTIHLRCRVSLPGTRTPTDPATVAVVKLKVGAVEITLSNPVFTRIEEGEYRLSIPTTTLAAGTYQVTVRLEDGPSKVLLLTDQFVLRAVP